MRKSKLREFDPGIYPRRLWVMMFGTHKEVQEAFSERDGSEILFPDQTGREPACTVIPVWHKESGKYGFLLFVQDALSVGQMAHEAVHVATYLFDEIGAEHTVYNQEPFAYLVGWVADCMERMKKGG